MSRVAAIFFNTFLTVLLLLSISSSTCLAIWNESQFTKTASQDGYNPGGFYTKDNKNYYLKLPGHKRSVSSQKAESVSRDEVLAAKIYNLAGISAPDMFLVKDKYNKYGVASEILPTFETAHTLVKNGETITDISKLPGIQEGLIIDAWLANWDVVGAAFGNIGAFIDSKDGKRKAIRIDVGGALQYSGVGNRKGAYFGNNPVEWDVLRGVNGSIKHPMYGINRSYLLSAQLLFGNLTKAQITSSLTTLTNIDDTTLKAEINKHWSGNNTDKAALIQTLITRKTNLVNILKMELAAFDDKKVADKNKQLKRIRLIMLQNYLRTHHNKTRTVSLYTALLNDYNKHINDTFDYNGNTKFLKQALKQIKDSKTDDATKTLDFAIVNAYIKAFEDEKEIKNLPVILRPDASSNNVMGMTALAGASNVASSHTRSVIGERIANNVQGISSGDNYMDNLSVWLKASGASATQKSSSSNLGYKMQQVGGTVGLELNNQYGVAFTYLSGTVKSKDGNNSSKDNVANYVATVYGFENINESVFVTGQIQYGISKIKKNRSLNSQGIEGIFNGKTSGSFFGASANIGYDYYANEIPNLHIVPTLGVSYNQVNIKSYTEKDKTDNILNRSIGKLSSNKTIGMFDIKASYKIDSSKSLVIIPELNAGIDYAISAKNAVTKITLDKSADSFKAKAISDPKIIYSVGSGIKLKTGDSFTIGLGYNYSFAKKFMMHSGFAKVKFDF